MAEARMLALEQKYIELLERRVGELESKLAHRDNVGAMRETGVPAPINIEADKRKGKDQERGSKDAATETEPKKEDEKKHDEPEANVRYRVVLNALDATTGEYRDRAPTTSTAAKKSSSEKKSNRAFTLRKLMRTQFVGNEEVLRSEGSEIDIESEGLQELLARVIFKIEPGQSPIREMTSPYMNLIWSWKEAEKMAAAPSEVPGATPMEEGEKDADGEEKEKPLFAPATGEEHLDAEKQARIDLRALMNLISTSSGDEMLDKYFKARKSMEESRTITFEALWTLFPRGSYVLSQPFLNQQQVFFVQSIELPEMESRNPRLSVCVYSYDWDGIHFNRVPYQYHILPFSDKKGISELPLYPLDRYRDFSRSGSNSIQDIASLKRTLITRGKTFFKYCVVDKGKQTFRYDGPLYHQRRAGLFRTESTYEDEADSFSSIFGRSAPGRSGYGRGNLDTVSTESTATLKGDVVVDFRSYLEYQSEYAPLLGSMQRYDGHLECSCTECTKSLEGIYRYSWDRKSKTGTFTDDMYMTFPPRVLGYSLDQKKWVHLLVDKLNEWGEGDRQKFDEKLIMSEENKNLISNSVKAHGKQNIVDYIPGKGKGLVILLWGVPGVGKTLTAESVALLAGKPLFSIGVSDIGTDSAKVDTNLKRVFDLAGLWGAVLLFDEADVFLEERGVRGSSIERDSMVSVLLRILEYYEGILILTTNRLKSFDIAVQSRIHIAIEYDDLDRGQRSKIFTEFVGQLRDKDLVEDWGQCVQWIKEQGCRSSINGRQIRNIVSTAMGLAHAEDRLLRRDDLHNVASNTTAFREALLEKEAVFRAQQIRSNHGP